ncbi:unnamed protein product [Arctogadus glacialis]
MRACGNFSLASLINRRVSLVMRKAQGAKLALGRVPPARETIGSGGGTDKTISSGAAGLMKAVRINLGRWRLLWHCVIEEGKEEQGDQQLGSEEARSSLFCTPRGIKGSRVPSPPECPRGRGPERPPIMGQSAQQTGR